MDFNTDSPQGKVVIFSAPSGSGKTTIVRHLLNIPDLGTGFSISATNRPPRGNEVHGVDYYFLSDEAFKQQINEGCFVEWEEVYPGRYYGTLRAEVERIWENGRAVLFDVDVKGGVRLKRIFGDLALSVFIMPPSVEVLRERLIARSTDPISEIEERVQKAREELAYAAEFDKVITNNILQKALEEAEVAVREFVME